MNRQIVTLTTDFGTKDGYVGAVKGVLLSRSPECSVVDLSHDLAPGDLRAAANLLRRAVPYFPAETVHLVVVDPGVGSERAILAVEHPRGRLIGPDNGCLDPFLEGAAIVECTRQDLVRDQSGATFHGRDRMAPAAAALVAGERVKDLGPTLENPLRLQPLQLERRGDQVHGSVEQVDRFGNLVTNIPWAWIEELPAKACAWVGDRAVCRRVSYYAQLPADKPGFFRGSEGTLELALNRKSLAETWQLEVGARVIVHAGGRPTDR